MQRVANPTRARHASPLLLHLPFSPLPTTGSRADAKSATHLRKGAPPSPVILNEVKNQPPKHSAEGSDSSPGSCRLIRRAATLAGSLCRCTRNRPQPYILAPERIEPELCLASLVHYSSRVFLVPLSGALVSICY